VSFENACKISNLRADWRRAGSFLLWLSHTRPGAHRVRASWRALRCGIARAETRAIETWISVKSSRFTGITDLR
jgi:hypothetical protein